MEEFMKRNMKVFVPLLLVLYLVLTYVPSASFAGSADQPQDFEQKRQVLLELMMQGLASSHFDPVMINDDFSEKVFDLYVERLDVNKRFFTQHDMERLRKYRHSLDEAVRNNNWELYELSNSLLDQRVAEVESYYQDILAQPFDFTVEEYVETDSDKRTYAKNAAELREMWRKDLKYQVLTRLEQKLDAQEQEPAEGEEPVEEKSLTELEKEARQAVEESMSDFFSRMEKLDQEDRLSLYLNSVVNVFDPHTAFFPPADKENFDISMSGQLEGIGATLQEKDGNIVVQRIVPGSASWKQGELESGDVILKVAQGEEEPVDIVDMRLDKAVQLIRGPKGSEVRLTVKKLDGNITVIPIIRDVVILEETYAKSAILSPEVSKFKTGYIKLPSFYADFDNPNGRRAASDVAEELEKLKEAGMDGLVLDLRNNGGGSLQDVVEMAGLFIETGPIVQVKGRQGKPYILEDKDPQVQWEGPLVIMVNEFSASASEIMAAAMQDYGRAVVVGSPSTFGKGTVQQFVDLDRFLPSQYSHLKPLGSLKLTLQKFYRINGGATQLRGVEPDIVLPDAYTYLDIGEKELDYPMEWTQIDPVRYRNTGSLKLKMEDVQQSSLARIAEDSVFMLIEANAKRLDRQQDLSRYPLQLEAYRTYQEELEKEAKQFSDVRKPIQGLEVNVLQVVEEDEDTEAEEARIEDFRKQLKKDVHLYEAMQILRALS